MRKLVVVILGLALFVFPGMVLAVDGDEIPFGKEQMVLEAGEVVDRDYFAAAESVEISGTVNGDVYAAGGQVLIDGVVNGDVLVAGGTVNISGQVAEDVRAVGGQVSVSGDVGGNLSVGSGNLEIVEGANIAGNLVAGAGNVVLGAPIEGNVRVGAGNLTIANVVSGDLVAGVGSMRLTSNGQVDGDAVYWSDKDASIAKGATVSGTLMRKDPPKEFTKGVDDIKKNFASGTFKGVKKGLRLAGFISALVVGLAMVLFLPKYLDKSSAVLKSRPWKALVAGLVALIVAPIILVLLMVTVVGIPLALILFSLYLIDLYVAKILVSFFVGGVVSQRFLGGAKRGWVMAVGLVVYALLRSIPKLGGLLALATVVFGLGAGLLSAKALLLPAKRK